MSKVYVDVETTGLNPHTDEIVQIAVVGFNGVAELYTYVRPVAHTSWDDAQQIHGISPEMVQEAPTLEDLAPRLRELFRNRIFAAYNAQFDASFLSRYFENTRICDVMLDYMAATGSARTKLADAVLSPEVQATARGVAYHNVHDALDDAYACMTLDFFNQSRLQKDNVADLIGLSEPANVDLKALLSPEEYEKVMNSPETFVNSPEWYRVLDFIRHNGRIKI